MRGKPKKLAGFRVLCYHYLYLLGKLKKSMASPRQSRYLMDEIIEIVIPDTIDLAKAF